MSRYASLKQECYEANLALPKLGLVDLTFGNVSVCAPELGLFCIKPSGVNYQELKPEDIVVLDLEGKQVEGSLRPSSDTETHRCLFQSFTGVRAVVHTHSRYAVAFAQANQGIPCLGTTHADYFYGEMPVTRAMTPEEISTNYEWNTGKVIVERFSSLNPLEIPAVLVSGHGPFTWGLSGSKAVENAQALEIVAEMAWHTLQLHPQKIPLPQSLLEKHFLRKHGQGAYYGQPKASGIN